MSRMVKKIEKLIYEGFRETDQRIRETFAANDHRFQEKFEKTDHEIDKLLTGLDRLKTEHNGLSDSFSLYSETMVAEGIQKLFAQHHIELQMTGRRILKRMNGNEIEVDVLGVGPATVIIVEVKVKLNNAQDVNEFIKYELERYFDFFPEHKGKVLYGAMAGMSTTPQTRRMIERHGLYLLLPSGDNMQIANRPDFVPRTFKSTD